MDPCELNVVIMALTNYFFTKLTKEEFVCLSIFLNELSKSMFSTSIFRDLCNSEGGFWPFPPPRRRLEAPCGEGKGESQGGSKEHT